MQSKGLTKTFLIQYKNSLVLLYNDFGLDDENKIIPCKTLCRLYT